MDYLKNYVTKQGYDMAKLLKFPTEKSHYYDIFPPRMQYALDELLSQNKQRYLKEGRIQGFWGGWIACSTILIIINLFYR